MRFTCVPGLTALKGLISMRQGRRLTPDYITNLPRGRRPLPIHAAPRFGLWSPTLMTYAHEHTHTHTLSGRRIHSHSTTSGETTNSSGPCETYVRSETSRGGRGEATGSSSAALHCRLNNTRRAVSTLSALALQRGRVIQEGREGPVHLWGVTSTRSKTIHRQRERNEIKKVAPHSETPNLRNTVSLYRFSTFSSLILHTSISSEMHLERFRIRL